MIRKHYLSFKNAFSGLSFILETQANFKIHIFLSIIAIFLGFLLKISYYEWLIIIILIIVGLAIESLNTIIEETADLINESWNEKIKIIKDMAAGVMLIFALGSIFIAGLIFLPKLLLYFK
jgi:diacylglycerol kinase (ATP)